MEKKSTLLSYNSFLHRSRKNLKDRKSNYAEEKIILSDEKESQAEDSPCPSDTVITCILNFSKSLFIKKSHTIGLVEIVLN